MAQQLRQGMKPREDLKVVQGQDVVLRALPSKNYADDVFARTSHN